MISLLKITSYSHVLRSIATTKMFNKIPCLVGHVEFQWAIMGVCVYFSCSIASSGTTLQAQAR